MVVKPRLVASSRSNSASCFRNRIDTAVVNTVSSWGIDIAGWSSRSEFKMVSFCDVVSLLGRSVAGRCRGLKRPLVKNTKN